MDTRPPDTDAEAAPVPEPQEPPRPRRRVPRLVVRLAAVLLAIVVSLLLTALTVDLGPAVRKRAEAEGSSTSASPAHRPGVGPADSRRVRFRRPDDRGAHAHGSSVPDRKEGHRTPPWWTIASRNLIVESVDMTDWNMVVETFANGRHNFPRLTPERKNPPGPSGSPPRSRRYTPATASSPTKTTSRRGARSAGSSRSRYRSDVFKDYRGRASFSNGTVRIQSYEPFSATMRSRFKIEGGKVVFDRIDLTSDGAVSVLDGEVDLGRWPEQIYRIKSHIDFPTQKNIFFHRDRFTASGQGDFQGTFHLFKGGRELKGTFTSPVAGVNDWRFPNLKGSVLWLPDRLEITDATSGVYGGTARFDYRMAPFGKKGVPTMATWDVKYRDVDLAQLTDFLRNLGAPAGRPRDWRESFRVAGRQVVAEARRRHRRDRGSAGVETMTREMPAARLAEELQHEPEAGPFNSLLWIGYVPVAGRIEYQMDPGGSRSARAVSRRRRPTSSSRARRRTASARGFPFTSRASTGRRATACSRHHDDVRIADRRDSDWRLRRVRRCDARGLLAAADRRGVLG